MIFLKFVLFGIPFIFGSLCEASMENNMEIRLESLEQKLNQQMHTLQLVQKHENIISDLQSHIANLEKENSVKDQRFQQEIHTIHQKHENSLSHLQTHILNLEKENNLLQSKVKRNAVKLNQLETETQNLKQHFENEIKNMNHEKQLFQIENRLSICEKKFQQLYKNDENEKEYNLHENEDSFPVHHNLEHQAVAKYPLSEPGHQNSPIGTKINIPNVSESNIDEIQSQQIDSLKKKITELQNEDVELKQQISEIVQQQIEQQQKVINTFTSFTAYVTSARDYNAGDVVQFNGIVSNYGGYYNQTSSIFTCPYSGYYLFSVNIMSDSGHKMDVGLRIDGDFILSAYAVDADYFDHASLTTVQLCQQGASVWVRCRENGSRIKGHYKHSSFTGTFLAIA